MGKHSKYGKSDFGSEIHDNHPSCMAGMLNVFDYHHWGIKNRRRKRSICWRKPRTNTMENEISIHPLLDADSGPVQVEQHFLKASMMNQTAPERSEGERKVKNSISRSLTHKQVKEYVDILEILDANEDVFGKILKDPHRGFTKSGSFPMPGSSRVRPLRSTSLEHKLKENWSFPKKQNLVLTLDFPDFNSSKSQKDYFGSKEESSDLKTRIPFHGLNHIMANGFRDIKKWIKHALEDKKSKKKHIGASDLNLSQRELHKMKKTSSLTESLDRYSQLFQKSIRREVKFNSRSLKLTNEDYNGAVKGKYPKFFRRVSSLSGLESLSSFMTELSRESFDLGIANSVDEEEDEQGNAVEKAEVLEIVEEEMEEGGAGGEILDEESSYRDLEREDPQQSLVSVSVSESCSSDQIAKKAETLISKVADANSGEIVICAPDSSPKSQKESKSGDLQEFPTWKKQEICEKYGIYFDFVKNVLEESGFLGDRDLGEKWHSEDQPLNPKLNDELVGDDRILLDSINETLVELYKRSSNYFPRTLITAGRMSPIPKGKHLVDEVWGRIRWNYVGLSDNPDRSLDDLVAHDLAKGDDGWMNIEPEAESVTLELEDLIFQELVSELVCL